MKRRITLSPLAAPLVAPGGCDSQSASEEPAANTQFTRTVTLHPSPHLDGI